MYAGNNVYGVDKKIRFLKLGRDEMSRPSFFI
jgi:hypothetical protein